MAPEGKSSLARSVKTQFQNELLGVMSDQKWNVWLKWRPDASWMSNFDALTLISGAKHSPPASWNSSRWLPKGNPVLPDRWRLIFTVDLFNCFLLFWATGLSFGRSDRQPWCWNIVLHVGFLLERKELQNRYYEESLKHILQQTTTKVACSHMDLRLSWKDWSSPAACVLPINSQKEGECFAPHLSFCLWRLSATSSSYQPTCQAPR